MVNTHTAVGSYELAPSGGAATDYTFKYVSGTLTINQSTATLSLSDSQVVIYSGVAAVYPASGIHNSGDGTVYSWQYSLNGTIWTSGMPVNCGTYQIKAGCAATPGYKAADSATVSFNITKALITASYAGENVLLGQPPVLEVTLAGFVNGETPTTAAGFIRPQLSNSETAIGIYTLTPAGGAADNYNFVYIPGMLQIMSRKADIFIADGQSAVYNGQAAVYPPGLISNTGGSTAYLWQYSSDSGTNWNSGMPVNVGRYIIRASTGASGSYDPSVSAAVVFSIIPATLTVSYGGESIAWARPRR